MDSKCPACGSVLSFTGTEVEGFCPRCDAEPYDPATEREVCEHEHMETAAAGRGEEWFCPDCGGHGYNSYAAMYGVSDADFI